MNVKEKVKEPLSASMLVEQLWELMWVAVSLGDSLGSWKSATMISATQVTHDNNKVRNLNRCTRSSIC